MKNFFDYSRLSITTETPDPGRIVDTIRYSLLLQPWETNRFYALLSGYNKYSKCSYGTVKFARCLSLIRWFASMCLCVRFLYSISPSACTCRTQKREATPYSATNGHIRRYVCARCQNQLLSSRRFLSDKLVCTINMWYPLHFCIALFIVTFSLALSYSLSYFPRYFPSLSNFRLSISFQLCLFHSLRRSILPILVARLVETFIVATEKCFWCVGKCLAPAICG